MKKRSKMTALMLACCMGTVMLAGCNNAAETETAKPQTRAETESVTNGTETTEPAAAGQDISEHVVLSMYCIGDEGGIYAQQHLDKLNEVLTEKINAEINPIMVSWGDFSTKLPMVWASGEAYDLTYTSNWSQYASQADKGAYMDITELFPTYAPKTYAEFVELDYLKEALINDKLYMVPVDKPEFTTFIFNYREDLRKKYNCPEIVDRETLEVYLQAIKDNEPSMIPFGLSGNENMVFSVFLNEQDWGRPLDHADGIFAYDLKNPTKVFNVVETPEYEEYVKKMREYFEKDFISQSIMAESKSTKEAFKGGQTGTYLGNMSNSNQVYQEVKVQHPDWEIGYYAPDLASGSTERVAVTNNGVAIGAYSKNPERAMMFIELVYQDQEVYDLVVNGLEGVTFEKDGETMTRWIPEGMNASELGLKNIGMGFATRKFELRSKDNSPLVDELEEEYTKVALFPGLAGFAIKQDEISAELAAIKAVTDEYKYSLDKGVLDPETGLAQIREKLKQADVDATMDVIKAQIADYLAD